MLQTSWRCAWEDLERVPPVGRLDQLIQAYREPHRHYHSLQHIEECLTHWSAVRQFADHPGEIELALWFHDAIYDPRRPDNEARSAEWALAVLGEADAPPAVRERVRDLILATRHDHGPTDRDQQLLVDVDLAILGAEPVRFAEYDRQVRAEYHWVPGFLYRMKRKAVLRSFVARPFIYNTAAFRERYEARARANLGAALG